MKEFIQTLKNIWSLKELREKILFTLGLILVYRFASYISLPAINMAEVGNLLEHYQNQGGNKQGAGLLGLLSSFTGGAFSRASIMALGIMPYISASIIVQLMGMAIPYLQKLQKDGESGRNTLNQRNRMPSRQLTRNRPQSRPLRQNRLPIWDLFLTWTARPRMAASLTIS